MPLPPTCPVLPTALSELVDELATMPGVHAVVLGGSRATGHDDAASDWDLGVYYRGALDTSRLATRGDVHPPGSWGRIMNGGAWLTLGGLTVDVLLRDLDVVTLWTARAEEGAFEVDALLGYVAGIPTYTLAAEWAAARVLRGSLPPGPAYPERLATTGHERWTFSARFSLTHAEKRAARGDVLGTVAQGSKAAIERAHALLCARRTWVFNEKRLVEQAGLAVAPMFANVPSGAAGLRAWVAELSARLLPG